MFVSFVSVVALFSVVCLGMGTTEQPNISPKPINITVYRITPRNYTGIRNMNTGDAPGDSFFGLYELSFPILCGGKKHSTHFSCRNIPILDVPGFNVYSKFLVEVDPRFGHYAECNPDPNNGTFGCTHFHFGRETCWYEDPKWSREFDGLCDRNKCRCDVVENHSVGMELLPFSHKLNSTYPEECSSSFEQLHDTTFSGKFVTFPTADEATCCLKCTQAQDSCQGYTIINNTCRMFSNISDFVDEAGVLSGMKESHAFLESQIANLAHNLNGSWFSTQAVGECVEGEPVRGDGTCWWRLIETTRTVNSTCVNNHVTEAVRNENPDCWNKCPQPNNITSTCFITCLFDTAAGNPRKGIQAIDPAVIVRAFEKAFENEDPRHGGCPTVPPCPPPCLPPHLDKRLTLMPAEI